MAIKLNLEYFDVSTENIISLTRNIGMEQPFIYLV